MMVHGFKRAEGRSWNVDGKNKNFKNGRMWIHATKEVPDDDAIKRMENHYKYFYRNFPKRPPMPSETGQGYPTSCILGCVDLHMILPQDEYQKFRRKNLGFGKGNNEGEEDEVEVPEEDDPEILEQIEENGSDYIFWCEAPRKLVVPCRYSGDHKIWDIPKQQLKTLQKGLVPVRWPGQGLPQQYETRFTQRFDLHMNYSIQPLSRPSAEPQLITLKKKDGTNASMFENVSPSKWTERDSQILADSFVHLFDFVPIKEQQQIINQLRNTGLQKDKYGCKGFFVEQTLENGTLMKFICLE